MILPRRSHGICRRRRQDCALKVTPDPNQVIAQLATIDSAQMRVYPIRDRKNELEPSHYCREGTDAEKLARPECERRKNASRPRVTGCPARAGARRFRAWGICAAA